MPDPFFNFFYKDRPFAGQDSSEWPEEWKTIDFKEYPRSPRVLLPRPKELMQKNLGKVLMSRKTERNFSERPLSSETFSSLLFWSAGLIHEGLEEGLLGKLSSVIASEAKQSIFRRPYPSGGARFPVEIYLAVFNGQDLKNDVYHYNVKKHALELIQQASFENIRQALPYDFAKKAAAVILLSFIGERTMKKYGNLGYKLGLLEAGHIGQNIYLVGAALGLGGLALGGMDYDFVQKELDLGEEETVFYQLAIGPPRKDKM